MAKSISRQRCNIFRVGAVLSLVCLINPRTDATAGAPGKAIREGPQSQLPAPGSYQIDPDHSFTYFSAWHHIVGRVRGRFDKLAGTIVVSRDLSESGADITVDTSTISTQDIERDEDLRGPDFFNVRQFPTMTYHGRGIHRVSRNSWVLDGSLTIRGITKAVPLTFTFRGLFPDTPPGKPARVAFHGTATTKRADFGISRDNLMELGPNPVGDDVAIDIDVEADASIPTQPKK